jgi:hypothetical protein
VNTGYTVTYTFAGKTYSASTGSTTTFQLNAGASYPIADQLTGIAELIGYQWIGHQQYAFDRRYPHRT